MSNGEQFQSGREPATSSVNQRIANAPGLGLGGFIAESLDALGSLNDEEQMNLVVGVFGRINQERTQARKLGKPFRIAADPEDLLGLLRQVEPWCDDEEGTRRRFLAHEIMVDIGWGCDDEVVEETVVSILLDKTPGFAYRDQIIQIGQKSRHVNTQVYVARIMSLWEGSGQYSLSDSYLDTLLTCRDWAVSQVVCHEVMNELDVLVGMPGYRAIGQLARGLLVWVSSEGVDEQMQIRGLNLIERVWNERRGDIDDDFTELAIPAIVEKIGRDTNSEEVRAAAQRVIHG